jgi:hypothetical protein
LERCPFCGASFETKPQLKAHIILSCPLMPY